MKELLNRDKWKDLFYTVSHPSDGFYWIRHQDKGSIAIALMMVVLFSFCYSMNNMYASFIVSDVDTRYVNSLTELMGVLLLFFIICVGNWSITCLMDGEGRLKDIVIAIGYSLVPLILTYTVATLVSQFIAENEEAFYYLIMYAGIAYTVIMMLVGIMQVHNYTLGKTLGTLLLTVLAVFVIIFLSLLIFNLLGQVIAFFRSIYIELIFRT